MRAFRMHALLALRAGEAVLLMIDFPSCAQYCLFACRLVSGEASMLHGISNVSLAIDDETRTQPAVSFSRNPFQVPAHEKFSPPTSMAESEADTASVATADLTPTKREAPLPSVDDG